MKTLSRQGVKAVALINRGGRQLRIELPLDRLGLSGSGAAVRDLWSRRDLPSVRSTLSFWLAPYETRLLRLTGKPVQPGSSYLGEIPARINIAVDGVRYLSKGALPASWVPARVDYAPSGSALIVGGEIHSHGIGILTNSRLELDARGQYRQLRFLPAVLGPANHPTVAFRVYADGKLLWQREQAPESKPQKVEVSIAGVRTIELVAESVDTIVGKAPVMVAWADAMVSQ